MKASASSSMDMKNSSREFGRNNLGSSFRFVISCFRAEPTRSIPLVLVTAPILFVRNELVAPACNLALPRLLGSRFRAFFRAHGEGREQPLEVAAVARRARRLLR